MKAKLIMAIGVVAALFIGTVLWRTDSFVYGDRLNWVESQGSTHIEAMNTSLAAELKAVYRVAMSLSLDQLQSGEVNWAQLSPYFSVAGLEVTGDQVQVLSIFSKEGTEAQGWSKDFIKAAIGQLQGLRSDMRFYVKPFQDSKKGKYVSILVMNGKSAVALIGSGEVFQSIVDSRKGNFSSYSVVTLNGLAVAHTTSEYLGTMMRDDPVYKWARGSGVSNGSQVLQTKGGEVIGLFENVAQTNLMVMSSASVKGAMSGRGKIFWQIILMGVGLILIGGAGLYYWLERMPIVKAAPAPGTPVSKPIGAVAKKEPNPSPESEDVNNFEILSAPLAAKAAGQEQEDKLSASVKVASALAQEMAGPLASILGHSQSILAQGAKGDVQSPTEAIVREARAVRGVLDKLAGFSSDEIKRKSAMKLDGPIMKALKEHEALCESKGVKVVRELSETEEVMIHADALTKAVSQIVVNAIEAMERRAEKKLTISTRQERDGIVLTIADTGEGIELVNIGKIFDPFYTTRSFQNHMGLGLSSAYGLLKEHGADVKVKSDVGRGTSFRIVFKPADQANRVQAPQEELFVVSSDLPILKDETRVEEEIKFKEKNSEVGRPLDVNIDQLLSFDEQEAVDLDEVKDMAKIEVRDEDEEFVMSHNLEEPETVVHDEVQDKIKEASVDDIFNEKAFKPQAGIANIDDLFTEPPSSNGKGFEGDVEKTVVLSGPTVEDLEDMSADLRPTGFVSAPKSAPVKKSSKLDSYKVEIRRPGKRI